MPDLTVQFDCGNPGNRAEEFQHMLIHLKVIKAGVPQELQGDEVWLKFQNIQDDAIERIEKEAGPWCLDRGLGLMRSSGETEPAHMVLLIADLTRMVD